MLSGLHAQQTVKLGIMCTTKLGQSRSQYYCVLQSLHQSTSQCYCVLQSLHKALPSTTVYYQAWTKHFPVLLFTAKLAQTRSSTTVYYKACTNTFQYYCIVESLHKHVPVLLCTTKLAQKRSGTTCTTKLAGCTFPDTHDVHARTRSRTLCFGIQAGSQPSVFPSQHGEP